MRELRPGEPETNPNQRLERDSTACKFNALTTGPRLPPGIVVNVLKHKIKANNKDDDDNCDQDGDDIDDPENDKSYMQCLKWTRTSLANTKTSVNVYS